MLCVDEKNTANAREFDVFCDCACFRILRNERKSSSHFFTKEARSFGSVAAPPMRLVADLLSSKRCGPDPECHRVSSTRPVRQGDRLRPRTHRDPLGRSTREA